jgi:hypothetical protein
VELPYPYWADWSELTMVIHGDGSLSFYLDGVEEFSTSCAVPLGTEVRLYVAGRSLGGESLLDDIILSTDCTD